MQEQFNALTDSQWQVIKKIIDTGRKRKHSLRHIVEAILWITRTGTQWRNMESKYPAWQIVYYYYSKWRDDESLNKLQKALVEMERSAKGREKQASVAAIDSQSIKAMAFTYEQKGVDANKKINGRKRHIVVDTLGLPLAIHVGAANEQDGVAGIELLWQIDKTSKRLQLIRADKAYRGDFTEASAIYGWVVEIAQKPENAKGFVPQKGRWQVERSFAWLNFFRRLSKDYERTTASAVAFIQLAFISIILARMP
jgi:transposase